MPRLVTDSKDNDDASHVSSCSRSADYDERSIRSCPSKTAESAANKLLSLAAIAEDHANTQLAGTAEDEDRGETGGEDHEANTSHPTSPGSTSRPDFDASYQQLPAGVHGMSPRWGMGNPPPHLRGMGSPANRYYGPGGMRPVYLGGSSPGASPGDMRFVRRPAGGRGGFPMWTSPPRPPFHPHAHMRGPSPMHPAYRGPVATPVYMGHPSSSYEDDGSVNSNKRPAPKRVSLGPTAKSILKKPRDEPAGKETESKVKESGSQADGEAKDTSTDEPALTTEEKSKDSTLESVVVEKESPPSDDPATKKQRIISPSSSNECQKNAEEEDLSSPQQQQRSSTPSSAASSSPAQFHQPPFGMVHRFPARPGLHPGTRQGPYAPPPMYSHPPGMRPYPVAMHPMGGPLPMFHRSMSTRGRPGFPPATHFYARAPMAPSPSPSAMAAGQQYHERIPDATMSASEAQVASSVPTSTSPVNGTGKQAHQSVADFPMNEDSGNTNRCIPLNPSAPNKMWSDNDATKEVSLPDFHRLVNFPDHLIKSRMLSVDGSCKGGNAAANDSASVDGKKRCVMCGRLRVSATYVRAKRSPGSNADAATNKQPEDSGVPNDGSSHIIPRQNKGVCTACDVTVWVALELDGLEIKWCKGCKNFRPWAAFGSKGSATKCVRCRDRQKEKYAMQKAGAGSNSQRSVAKADDAKGTEHPCSLALVAANGLRSLMNTN